MNSWLLWKALQNPPTQHPLYQRMVNRDDPLLPSAIIIITLLGSVAFVLGIMAWVSIILLVLLVAVTGILPATRWAMRIAAAIATEKTHSSYALLGVTPAGFLGAYWVICLGCIYRESDFQNVRLRYKYFFTFACLCAFLLLGVGFIVVLALNPRADRSGWLPLILYINMVLLLYYLDFPQSIVTGCLVGLIIPAYTRTLLEARVLALFVSLLLQITIYLFSAYVIFTLLPTVLALQNEFVRALGITIIGSFVFYMLREFIIKLLWKLLLFQLSETTAMLSDMV